MKRYDKLKKAELVEILTQMDADENDGLERGGLTGYTRAELLEEANRRELDEGEHVLLENASAAEVVAEWDARGEVFDLLDQFSPGDIFDAAESKMREAFGRPDRHAYESLAKEILAAAGKLDIQRVAMVSNAMEFRRQMCDLAGLGYHACSTDIINFIAAKLGIEVIC